jgi:hypothetical protein
VRGGREARERQREMRTWNAMLMQRCGQAEMRNRCRATSLTILTSLHSLYHPRYDACAVKSVYARLSEDQEAEPGSQLLTAHSFIHYLLTAYSLSIHSLPVTLFCVFSLSYSPPIHCPSSVNTVPIQCQFTAHSLYSLPLHPHSSCIVIA